MNELGIKRTPETVGAEIRGLTAQAKQMTLWFGIEIGRRLCEVKEMIGHGEWLPYLKAQTEFSQSTASRFMTLYREYGAQQQTLFGAESNYPTLNNLSISDAAAVKLRSTVDTFLSGKHFVNDITRESITDKLVTALGSDDARGKSIDDLFTGLVTDQNGKEIPGILVADPASKARFSSDHSGMVPPAGGAKEYVAQKYKNNPFFRG